MLLWIVLKDLSRLMSFKSDRALQTAKLCKGNHKAWQLLKIFNFGTSQLLVRYVSECIQNDIVPTATDYINWSKLCTLLNYLYAHEQILTYCQALFIYWKELRTCNYDFVLSAKDIFSVLFFGWQQPKYQYISSMETCDYVVLYPVEVI